MYNSLLTTWFIIRCVTVRIQFLVLTENGYLFAYFVLEAIYCVMRPLTSKVAWNEQSATASVPLLNCTSIVLSILSSCQTCFATFFFLAS